MMSTGPTQTYLHLWLSDKLLLPRKQETPKRKFLL